MNLKNYYISFEDNPDLYFDQACFIDDKNHAASVPYLLWDKALVPFPVQIAQWGLYLVNLYYNGDTSQKDSIAEIADFLIENSCCDEHGVYWDMAIVREEYALTPPWKSAMAQGEIISFLLRASQITDNEHYTAITHEAVAIFDIPVEKGGVQGLFPDDSICLEEYSSKEPSCVLNGMIFAVFGLYDYLMFFEKKMDLFNELCSNLAENLFEYDLSFWSRYDLFQQPKSASVVYHWLHIELLRKLAEINKENKETFIYFANKWETQLNSFFCRFLRNFSRLFQRTFYKR